MINLIDDQAQRIAEELNRDLESLAEYERQVAKATAAMNEAISKVAQPYLEEIDKLKKSIQQRATEVIEKANTNRSLLTHGNKKKTISLRAGTISWRDSSSLVFDISNAKMLELLRRLGRIRKFVIKKPVISKEAIEKDGNFAAELAKRGAAHFERLENLTIKLFIPDGTIVKDDDPYKIAYPREE